jgi:Ni,Fe-hydrogenase III large subunit/Ni,Fe-hydrogenase III component G
MRIEGLNATPLRLLCAMPVWIAEATREEWSAVAETAQAENARLVALWGTDRGASGFVVSATYAFRSGLLWLRLPLRPSEQTYPDIASRFPTATRMQRAMHDLIGLSAEGARDQRPWLNHGAWPSEYHPLRHDRSGHEVFDRPVEPYPYVRVAGEGVHEIAVGPIHAGVIEPGHFRFSVVGEKVLRLEERLGYVHKGIEKRFERMPVTDGYRLAGRVSGDSTVAYAWAYCMAVESALDWKIAPRAAWLRALLLERERVANHLGDLGALGNDAGLAFGLAQFSRLREEWLRLNAELFGHRLLMDRIVPGGVAFDVPPRGVLQLREQCDAVEIAVRTMETIYDEHAGLQDRFLGAGRVTRELALQLGLCGLAGRASGLASDLRVQHPCAPYDVLDVHLVSEPGGDVAARVRVRFREIGESLRLLRVMVMSVPNGETLTEPPAISDASLGMGWVEGWRGEVLVALEVGVDGTVRRCHCHDPSWQNWPVLEHAVIDNIVPDFPLINKSFNLSYAGHDL